MTEAVAIADFVTLAESGVALRTRDRRDVTVTAIDAAAGILRGAIAGEGELAWRRDGSFAAAPQGVAGGVAGPLDLVAPAAPATSPRSVSLRDALNAPDSAKDRAPFCCD
ncbi:MAG TPA: hypothetical protein PLR41_16330 [Alphaproteobacteria bacterium]|nr:hypothetical protein [Alphaproteobacteria bacterium]